MSEYDRLKAQYDAMKGKEENKLRSEGRVAALDEAITTTRGGLGCEEVCNACAADFIAMLEALKMPGRP